MDLTFVTFVFATKGLNRLIVPMKESICLPTTMAEKYDVKTVQLKHKIFILQFFEPNVREIVLNTKFCAAKSGLTIPILFPNVHVVSSSCCQFFHHHRLQCISIIQSDKLPSSLTTENNEGQIWQFTLIISIVAPVGLGLLIGIFVCFIRFRHRFRTVRLIPQSPVIENPIEMIELSA